MTVRENKRIYVTFKKDILDIIKKLSEEESRSLSNTVSMLVEKQLKGSV